MADINSREAFKDFIINEIITKRPDEADNAEMIADYILNLGFMQTKESIQSFLKAYFRN